MADHVEQIELTDREMAVVRRYARIKGISVEDAASNAVANVIAKRVRGGTHKSPANNVRKFRSRTVAPEAKRVE